MCPKCRRPQEFCKCGVIGPCAEHEKQIAALTARLEALTKERDEARGTIHSLTFGELPQNVREAEIWESHIWDNMTVWEARDNLLAVLSMYMKQRDDETASNVSLVNEKQIAALTAQLEAARNTLDSAGVVYKPVGGPASC